MKSVDFYHVDSMETINYEPIYHHLEDAVMVAVPNLSWFDFERAVEYFQRHNLPFRMHPRINPDCVITTQRHCFIGIPEYRTSISMRLMYGLAEKAQNHAFKFNKGFDVILVPGKYSQNLLRNYFHTIIVGFPKYDAFFRGEINRQKLVNQFRLDPSRKTILYLPTWRIHSSLDSYRDAIRKIINSDRYNFIFKPHTVTVREERYHIDYFHREISENKMLCLEYQIGLDKLFVVADIVIADGMGGAFWESVLIANLPTLAIFTKGNFQKTNLERKIQEFAIVNNDPNALINDLEKVEDEPLKYKEKRREWSDKLVSFRDGTAGKRAADEIQNFIELRKQKRKVFDFITLYPHVYLSRAGRFFRGFYTRFKKKVSGTFPMEVIKKMKLRLKWFVVQKGERKYWENWFKEHQNDDAWLNIVLTYFGLNGNEDFGDKVLVDIGSGPIGILTKLKAKEKIAVDPLAVESRDKTIRRIKTPAERIPLPDESADCVFSYNVLQHVISPEKVLAEGTRILKKSGIFYLLEQLNLPVDKLHPHSLKLEMFEGWILRNNFEIIKKTKQDDCYFDHPSVPGSGYSILCLILRKRA